LPVHTNTHRFGGGRPRVPDRLCADTRFSGLRTGCQWPALDHTAWCAHSMGCTEQRSVTFLRGASMSPPRSTTHVYHTCTASAGSTSHPMESSFFSSATSSSPCTLTCRQLSTAPFWTAVSSACLRLGWCRSFVITCIPLSLTLVAMRVVAIPSRPIWSSQAAALSGQPWLKTTGGPVPQSLYEICVPSMVVIVGISWSPCVRATRGGP